MTSTPMPAAAGSGQHNSVAPTLSPKNAQPTEEVAAGAPAAAEQGPPVFFHKPNGPFGRLSNFWEFPPGNLLPFNGRTYRTSEHLYQSLKFNYPRANTASQELAEVIRSQNTPYKAKILTLASPPRRYTWQQRLGAVVAEHRARGARVRTDWEEVKREIMLRVLRAKFCFDRSCRDELLSTGSRPLAEHTTTDCFWADGGGGNGRGQNVLGRLLAIVREELRRDEHEHEHERQHQQHQQQQQQQQSRAKFGTKLQPGDIEFQASRDPAAARCKFCSEHRVNCFARPCGHRLACTACLQLGKVGNVCLQCGENIVAPLKVYC